ncbi:MAG TPA: hypothetical protein VFS36_15555 [Chitinophagaceae bacterium]|nr:hypothetical protein [Chitinophagaceae bacterium]
MKYFTAKKLNYFIITGVATLLFFGCEKLPWPHPGHDNDFPGNEINNFVNVTDCNLNGWVKQQKNGNTVQFMNGPAGTFFNKGSVQFSLVNISSLVRIRDTSYNGVLLSDITQLKFLTYVQHVSTDTVDAPFIVLQIDTSGDGVTDFPLLFVPRYQDGTFPGDKPPIIQKTKLNEWQTWDATKGVWWNEGVDPIDPDFGGHIYTLKNIIKKYPAAKIVNDATGGGIRLTVGAPYPRWINYLGNVDAIAIGIKGKTTIYDFEQSIADAGEDRVIYKNSSQFVKLQGNGSGGVAPYTYSWSDGKSVFNQKEINVHPSQTTTYTLTVTDANGCSGTDEVTVFRK